MRLRRASLSSSFAGRPALEGIESISRYDSMLCATMWSCSYPTSPRHQDAIIVCRARCGAVLVHLFLSKSQRIIIGQFRASRYNVRSPDTNGLCSTGIGASIVIYCKRQSSMLSNSATAHTMSLRVYFTFFSKPLTQSPTPDS